MQFSTLSQALQIEANYSREGFLPTWNKDYLSFSNQTGWEVKQLNLLERICRTLFGAYQSTHLTHVVTHLKNEEASYLPHNPALRHIQQAWLKLHPTDRFLSPAQVTEITESQLNSNRPIPTIQNPPVVSTAALKPVVYISLPDTSECAPALTKGLINPLESFLKKKFGDMHIEILKKNLNLAEIAEKQQQVKSNEAMVVIELARIPGRLDFSDYKDHTNELLESNLPVIQIFYSYNQIVNNIPTSSTPLNPRSNDSILKHPNYTRMALHIKGNIFKPMVDQADAKKILETIKTQIQKTEA